LTFSPIQRKDSNLKFKMLILHFALVFPIPRPLGPLTPWTLWLEQIRISCRMSQLSGQAHDLALVMILMGYGMHE
jgi:hypothetical protein